MAKLQVIRLTPKEVLSEIENKGVKTPIRKIELDALESLLVIAAGSQKDFKKMNVCYDLIEQVKAITDEQENFKINSGEVKDFIIPAFEKCVDQRPGSRYFARNMFKSIEKCEEIEVS